MPNFPSSSQRRRAMLLWFALSASAVARAEAPPTLQVYVVPQFSAEEIHRSWSPLLKRVGEQAGVNLVLNISTSIPKFEQSFAGGAPDLLYLNPYHAVMARRSAGYEPILCDSNMRLTGILVVRRAGPIQRLHELEGKAIAFPAPNAFGASLYMRALLSGPEQLGFQAHYVSTHTNVFRQVVNGEVAAGGAVRQTLEKESPQLRAQLRIVYETPPTMPHPLAVHPRVSPELRRKLLQAFIALGADAGGQAMLRQVQLAQPRPVSYADYAPLERLGLDKYLVQPQE
jgi:phosphonate transport system substrate-binding protein